MRRILLVLTVALLMAAMMVATGPAFADHVTAHPFCGEQQGSDEEDPAEYAQEHITDMAQNESPGLTGPPTARDPDPATEHAPGAHRGFAVCDPSGHAENEE
jgi:hypothetical protein